MFVGWLNEWLNWKSFTTADFKLHTYLCILYVSSPITLGYVSIKIYKEYILKASIWFDKSKEDLLFLCYDTFIKHILLFLWILTMSYFEYGNSAVTKV